MQTSYCVLTWLNLSLAKPPATNAVVRPAAPANIFAVDCIAPLRMIKVSTLPICHIIREQALSHFLDLLTATISVCCLLHVKAINKQCQVVLNLFHKHSTLIMVYTIWILLSTPLYSFGNRHVGNFQVVGSSII